MSRWFRFYEEAAHDSKVLLLPSDTLRWQWVVLLTVASQHEGVIPSVDHAALALRLKPTKAGEVVGKLASAGLLDRVDGGYFAPHNWSKRQFKSDQDPTAAERQKRFRERNKTVTKQESNALRNTPNVRNETRTETEAYTEPEADKRFTNSSQNYSLPCENVEDVKGKRSARPRHCAVSRDKKFIFVHTETPEWEAYSADFRETNRQEPIPDDRGGFWFKLQGEQVA